MHDIDTSNLRHVILLYSLAYYTLLTLCSCIIGSAFFGQILLYFTSYFYCHKKVANHTCSRLAMAKFSKNLRYNKIGNKKYMSIGLAEPTNTTVGNAPRLVQIILFILPYHFRNSLMRHNGYSKFHFALCNFTIVSLYTSLSKSFHFTSPLLIFCFTFCTRERPPSEREIGEARGDLASGEAQPTRLR